MCPARAYLDTCIVSGLAKGDLTSDNVAALLCILEARKAGLVELFTSEVVREEISKIPLEHRTRHSFIYGLLADVPSASTHFQIPPFRPVPVFRRYTATIMESGRTTNMMAGGEESKAA